MNLDELTGEIDATCMALLGEDILFSRAAGPFTTVRAHVYYRDAVRDLVSGKMSEQDIMCIVQVSALAAKPTMADRIRLPKRAGKTYRPVNVVADDSGTHWEFDLQTVV